MRALARFLFASVVAGCGARTPLDASSAAASGGANGGAAPSSSSTISTSSTNSSGGGLSFTTSPASSSSSSAASGGGGSGGNGSGAGVVALTCPTPLLQSGVATVTDAGTSDQPSLAAVAGGPGVTAVLVYTRVTSSEPKPSGRLFALVERGESFDTIALAEFDEAGSELWRVPIDTAGTVEGPISLLTSPKLDAVLVAWPELEVGSTNHVIRLARVDCAPAP